MRRAWGAVRSFVVKATPWVVFVCMAAAMLFDPRRDTLGVASAAFAVSLALASVTFSYARVQDGKAIRDELVFAGERLLLGAAFFLVASIVKHAAHDIPEYGNAMFRLLPESQGPPPDTFIFSPNNLALLLVVAAFVMFVVGLIYAQMGMSIVIAVANQRVKRRPGQNDFFESAEATNKRMAALDLADKEGTKPTTKPRSETASVGSNGDSR